MRVALGKVDGVESVDVTLKRGVAHLRLKDGNRVTLAQLRQLVKDAGYTSRDAVVTVTGTLERREESTTFTVAGTNERFRLEPDASAPLVLKDPAVGRAGIVEIQGIVPEAAGDRPVMRVRTITAR